MLRSLVASTFAVAVLAWATPAAAGVVPDGCAFDDQSGLLTFAADSAITLVRDGDALLLNDAGCGGATVSNTDLIQLFSDEPITIDLAGGSFSPGATDEGDGSSEIEIEVYGTWTFTLLGSPEADQIVMGLDHYSCGETTFSFPAINLDATETTLDADVFDCDGVFYETGLSSIEGRGGGDILSLGGEGLDQEIGGSLTLLGGPGDDALTSGGGPDILRGQQGTDTLDTSWSASFVWIFAGSQSPSEPHAGMANTAVGTDIDIDAIFGFERFVTSSQEDNLIYGSDRDEVFVTGGGDDEIHGNGGKDELLGQAGHDQLIGGRGDDIVLGGVGSDGLFGNAGADELKGAGGSDQLFGGIGNDLLVGGPDPDSCLGGPGQDHLVGCEGVAPPP